MTAAISIGILTEKWTAAGFSKSKFGANNFFNK